MKYKQNLIFKRKNGQLEMNSKVGFKVIDITGIEASSYTINKSNSEKDGAEIMSVKVEPRPINIIGEIEKNNNELINREELIRFFKPQETGEMYITRNNIERKIQYNVSSLFFPTNKMYSNNEFQLNLECVEEPYFLDAKNRGNFLTLINPQFTFPLAISKTKGRALGYKTFKPVMPLVNDGDKETGIEIIVTAKRGKMDNIKLILNDNEYIKVNITLKQWDILRINTNERKKAITLNGTNIINKIDRNSTFFKLNMGKNILKYECDNGGTNIDIDVQFYRKFLGV